MSFVQVIKPEEKLIRRGIKVADRLRVAPYCRVSKDTEEQLNSYKSQKLHYKQLVESNPNWVLADIYADEAISGTQVTKRTDFQRMVNDAMNGQIDLVITKSISRFARNTLDTLKYVRMFREKNIAIIFEKENINTLTMNGEMLLVILSSLAQQESESISANVKLGLKMKMKRGELIGFQGCLGYDYNAEDKTISVNREEAEIVKYIFQRYVEGAGGFVIAKELTRFGYKTKYGNTKWGDSTVRGIIKNEKYKGDLLMGKTFTVDPISHRRLENMGEEERYYIKDHHEPIISEELFNEAQRILSQRSKRMNNKGRMDKCSHKYAFSSKLFCAFCGGTFSRRKWNSGYKYEKYIWQCNTSIKSGRKDCPDSKGIDEQLIEGAFIDSYKLICNNNNEVVEEFIHRLETCLGQTSVEKKIKKIDRDIALLNKKVNNLLDIRLENGIDKDNYDGKYAELTSKIENLQQLRAKSEESFCSEKELKQRILEFRKTLKDNEVLNSFDRAVFESIVDKVIIGEYNEDGSKNPYCITFVYKTGLKSPIDYSTKLKRKENIPISNSPDDAY